MALFRRHFFLVAAVSVIALMALLGGGKFLLSAKGGASGPGGGPPGAVAPAGKGGPGGGPQAKGGGRPGGPGGRGGVQVTPAIVGSHTFTDHLQVLGVAKGRESVTLTSNTSELVNAVRFRPGDHVRAGQVLVELRRTEEDAGIQQAQSDLDLAKINADRWNQLAERGIAPRSTAEQYQAAYQRAQAALEAAQSRAGDRVIRAPFAGVVGLSDIAPGALISPGSAIATLDDLSVVRVDFDVPDRFLPLVREGGEIIATTDAYPGQSWTGRIARLDTRIDERTRTIKARAEFANPGEKLKPGMLIRVGVDRGQRTSPAAPEAAVQFSGGQAYVFVITERNGGTFADQRPVLVGEIQDGLVEIRDGLALGDKVVADGLNRVQPGQAVMVAGAGGPRGPGGPGGGSGRPPGAAGPAGANGGSGRPAGGGAPAPKGGGANPT